MPISTDPSQNKNAAMAQTITALRYATVRLLFLKQLFAEKAVHSRGGTPQFALNNCLEVVDRLLLVRCELQAGQFLQDLRGIGVLAVIDERLGFVDQALGL